MAPGCKPGARRRYAGSNPALPTSLPRALHSGNASAFQAEVASSILAARSKFARIVMAPPFAPSPPRPWLPLTTARSMRAAWCALWTRWIYEMALARDGSMWVSDDNPPYALLRFAKNGRVNRYPTEFPPFEMTIGADGALYVGSYYLVARVETGKSKRGSYVEYPTPSMGSTGTLILASDGNVWFTEGGVAQDSIANVAPNGAITEYPTNNAYPFAGLVQGKDGNLGFGASRFNQPGVVMNINPMTGAMQSLYSSSVCGPTYSLARDSSGEMWFLCDNAGIAHLATDGTYTIVATSGADDFPSNLIVDRSGKLWCGCRKFVKNGRAFRFVEFETPDQQGGRASSPTRIPAAVLESGNSRGRQHLVEWWVRSLDTFSTRETRQSYGPTALGGPRPWQLPGAPQREETAGRIPARAALRTLFAPVAQWQSTPFLGKGLRPRVQSPSVAPESRPLDWLVRNRLERRVGARRPARWQHGFLTLAFSYVLRDGDPFHRAVAHLYTARAIANGNALRSLTSHAEQRKSLR